MTIVVFGKTGCGLCKAALEKLAVLGLSHRYVPMDDPRNAIRRVPDGAGGMVESPEDWRVNGEVAEALAMVAEQDAHDLGRPPVLVVNGKVYDYPGAMRLLRETSKI